MISPSPVKVFFGWCLMAVGGLIALTCGLCTLGFMAAGAVSAIKGGGAFAGVQAIAVSLMFGGLPTAIGAGIFVVGWKMTRNREPGAAR